MNNVITCVKCGIPLRGKQVKFCSASCKNDQNQSYAAQQARGLKRKLALINQLGGQCAHCGYKKNSSALDLHHVEPRDKSFALDLRSLSNRKQSKIDEEVSKCILLCRNCHSELHNPQHNLE
ncbi:HNH endonuclease [Candidatus Saccharibacteria bacterium]|nr:HNH endonuclease [Candidatus Saccharibacteria bacterium]